MSLSRLRTHMAANFNGPRIGIIDSDGRLEDGAAGVFTVCLFKGQHQSNDAAEKERPAHSDTLGNLGAATQCYR